MKSWWPTVTVSLFITLNISYVNVVSCSPSGGHVCKLSNIEIDNDDGRKNYIELNLKKLDHNDDTNSCPGCNLSEDSKTGGFIYNQWLARPPSFQIIFTPGELIADCDLENHHLPHGLCSKATHACSDEVCDLEEIEELAETIKNGDALSESTGNEELDKKIGLAIVHLNIGNLDKAIEEFTSVLQADPRAVLAYFGRGAAYARKGLQNAATAHQALHDFTKAIEYDIHGAQYHVYFHRAQVYLMLGKYSEAHKDATTSLKHEPSLKVNFLRGVSSIMLELFEDAENDFRKNLMTCTDKHVKELSHFYLGLTLYYRGKIRNAVEVFKEVLKENPQHFEASLSLAQGFKDLGNLRAAATRFSQSADIQPNHSMIYKLRGNMLYDSGDSKAALDDFQKCLQLDETNANCMYMSSVSKISLGHFYSGVKDATKVMVSNIPRVKASPEFIKAHYLREYARYVHTHLDEPVQSVQPDKDLPSAFLDRWVKLKRFNFTSYKEQPGLQPQIEDVFESTSHPEGLKPLLCRAEELGKLSQVSVDGILPNRRLNLAVGLAAIHTAQVIELKWKALKTSKTNNNERTHPKWQQLYHTAVAYRRLASLDEPILWVEYLPDFKAGEGHRADIPFVRGSVTNTKVTPYYELAFKLAKTMLEHYSGEGAVAYPGLKEDIQKAKNCEELLDVARRRQINPNGFLVSTQVPSLRRVSEDYRLDGGVLVLTEDFSHKTVFALNVASTPDRTASYSAEMNHLLLLLQEEMRKMGSNKVHDVENVISHILSISYYFYNLIPLSKGSSAVAYSVMMGLLMSVGRQITSRIPNGRLLDLEAMLAGAPDAFVLVAKKWMSIKKSNVPLSSLPLVWESLPTVRSVLEVLSINSTACS